MLLLPCRWRSTEVFRLGAQQQSGQPRLWYYAHGDMRPKQLLLAWPHPFDSYEGTRYHSMTNGRYLRMLQDEMEAPFTSGIITLI